MTDNVTQFDVAEEAGDDMDLVHASKNGNVAAFEQLVKRYDRRLLRIAQSVTRNREDSQDAVQEAFLKAYQHLADFREACQFSTWLIRITVNQALMKLRSQRGTRETSLDEDFGDEGDILHGKSRTGLPIPSSSAGPPNYGTYCGRLHTVVHNQAGQAISLLRLSGCHQEPCRPMRWADSSGSA